MKEVKELADLEAMRTRERDAWFAERFDYGIRHEIFYKDIRHCANLKLDGHEVDFPCFTQYIGNQLLKAEMMKRGYKWRVFASNADIYVAFLDPATAKWHGVFADNEIEATWKAAALALLG